MTPDETKRLMKAIDLVFRILQPHMQLKRTLGTNYEPRTSDGELTVSGSIGCTEAGISVRLYGRRLPPKDNEPNE